MPSGNAPVDGMPYLRNMISALLLSASHALLSGWTFVDSPPGDYAATVHSIGDRLVAIRLGLPRVSDDGGETWRTSSQGLPSNAICAGGDEENGILLAYCAGKFYRSADRADSWQDWSEGFATDLDITPYYGLALGDTVAVFITGLQTETRLWVRQGDSPWKRARKIEYTSDDLIWTGGAFLLRQDFENGTYALRRSTDGVSWESQAIDGDLRSFAARNDTTWMLVKDTLRTSLDHGKTWMGADQAFPGRQFVVSERGFYGFRNDSIHAIDPRTGASRFLRAVEDGWLESAYSTATMEVLTLWYKPSLVSMDSGRTWTSQRRPEAAQFSESFARHDKTWYVDSRFFWSRKDGAPWTAVDTVWASSFRSHEGLLFAGGYVPRFLQGGVWTQDTLTRPAGPYSTGILRWIEGLGVPAITDGNFVWLRPRGTTIWRRLEKSVLLQENANKAVGFASRIWFAEHTYRQYLGECLFSFDTTTGALVPHAIPHYEGAYEIAISGKTMWVATDLGLMRSDDTAKSFQEAGLPPPWNNLAAAKLLVHGDTIVATMQTMAMRIVDSPDRATWISFDNGGNWTRDTDTSLVASAFFADSTGLYAFMQGRGIHRWTPSTSVQPASPRSFATRTFSLRRTNRTWKVVGTPGETIEIRDTSGKLVISTTLDANGISGSIPLSSGVHHLSTTSTSGGRSISVVVP